MRQPRVRIHELGQWAHINDVLWLSICLLLLQRVPEAGVEKPAGGAQVDM